MDQVYIDDCLRDGTNRFELVLMIAQRAKQLTGGLKPLVQDRGEKYVVTSMREIQEGKVSFSREEDDES